MINQIDGDERDRDKEPMDDLIIRSLQGRATRAEELVLKAWRVEQPKNEQRYQSVARLWELTGAASPAWKAEAPSVDRLLEAGTKARLTRTVPSARTLRDRFSGRLAGMVAAAAALVVVGFGLGQMTVSDQGAFLSSSEIVTGAGEMTTVSLGDGSTIRLGPRSRLRLVEQQGQRFAHLDGRAFFGVESDPARRFTVQTAYGDAEVFGTRFEVRTEQDEFRVLVVEGSVEVSAGGSEVRLSESEMSRSLNGSSPTTERVADVFQHLDWLGNTLVFQATPVDRAFSEIERRYGVEFVIDDPSVSRLTVTAVFTGQSVEDVVQIVCQIIGARCVTEDGRVRVGGFGSTAGTPAEV